MFNVYNAFALCLAAMATPLTGYVCATGARCFQGRFLEKKECEWKHFFEMITSSHGGLTNTESTEIISMEMEVVSME